MSNICATFLTTSCWVLPHFFLDYFHHLSERGEGESSHVSGGCAVGEVVNKGGDALEAPAQEAEINFKLNLADRMLNFETFRHAGAGGFFRLEQV